MHYIGFRLNSVADPDETPHDVASHQGLHCLFKRNVKLMKKNQPDTPKMKNGLLNNKDGRIHSAYIRLKYALLSKIFKLDSGLKDVGDRRKSIRIASKISDILY